EPGDEAAERGLAQDFREARDPARLHPLQRVPARQVQLPILRRARGPYIRSSAAALARRAHHLDQRRRRLLALQSHEGQHDDGRGADVAVADAVPAEREPSAPQRPALPAELSARQLARLFLLGHRTRAVSRGCPRRSLSMHTLWSSSRKRGPIAPHTTASGIWVPAFAETTT